MSVTETRSLQSLTCAKRQGYQPPADLDAFLRAGPPPLYIGFGSVPVKDPAKMTQIIFDAVRASGQRALVSAGWGGLGGAEVPPEIFILGQPSHFTHRLHESTLTVAGFERQAIALTTGYSSSEPSPRTQHLRLTRLYESSAFSPSSTTEARARPVRLPRVRCLSANS